MLPLASIPPGTKSCRWLILPVAPFLSVHGHGYSSRRSDSLPAHGIIVMMSFADRYPVRAVLYRYSAQQALACRRKRANYCAVGVGNMFGWSILN